MRYTYKVGFIYEANREEARYDIDPANVRRA